MELAETGMHGTREGDMTNPESRVVDGVPWAAAVGSVAMTGLAITRWSVLSDVNRVACGIDAGAYAVAVLPLARRRSSGWWMLYLATLMQPVLGGIEAAQGRTQWPSAVGRSAGAVVLAVGLLRIRRSYV